MHLCLCCHISCDLTRKTATYKSWITFISYCSRPMSSTSNFSGIEGLNSIQTSTWNGNLFTRMERFYLECGKSFVFLFVLQPSKQAAKKHLAPICPPIRIEAGKTKTNHNSLARGFPRFVSLHVLALSFRSPSLNFDGFIITGFSV